MRRSDAALAALAALALALAGAGAHAVLSAPAEAARISASRALVGELGLSDLTLFTEARYTRHPSLADLNTPFQDHPMSFEHFPSGSLVPAPRGLGMGRLGQGGMP